MKKVLKLCSFGLFIFLLFNNFAYADGNYTISLSSNSVSKGKSVTLYVKGNDLVGGFTVSSSDTTVASVANSSIWVENNTVSVTVNTLKNGTTTIKVMPTTVSDNNGNDLSLGAKTLSLTVGGGSNTTNNNVKLSNDATLKSLSIDGVSISPEFKSDIFEYMVEVAENTEKVKINAVANHSKATVSGSGDVDVSEGTNKLEVVVTAEDKSTKTYVINVNVKESSPIEVKIGKSNYLVVRKESDLPEVDLFEKTKIKIGDDEVSCYYNDKLNMYLIGLKDENGNVSLYVYDSKKNSYIKYKWVTVGGVTLYLIDCDEKLSNFSKYSVTIKNTKVDIYKLNSSDKIGLLYGINVLTGNKGYYVYDEEEATLARYFDDEVYIYKDREEKYKNYMMILAGGVSAIIIIGLIISLVRGMKNKRKIKG